MSESLPYPSITFWPVGCGDSITVRLDEDTFVQIDLHDVEDAQKDDDPRTAIVDRLVELLPTPEGASKPYLAAFGATHLDSDHICGFADLLDRVTIGDLWFTPRVLHHQREQGLSDDAEAFRDEAERRIKKLRADGQVGSGDRIRIIGYHDLLKDYSDIYEGLPEESVTTPGNEFTHIDGEDHSDAFRAFVHAPFKDDGDKERNDTSFGLQITLKSGETNCKAIVLGDLAYPTVKRIFDRSNDDDLEFDVFLAPHHCSRSALAWKDEGEESATFKKELADQIESAGREGAHIVASSTEIPESDKEGANPPHADAARRYQEIVDSGHFLCTEDEAPGAISFQVTADGCERVEAGEPSAQARSQVPGAVAEARPGAAPAVTQVGFGRG